MLVRNLRQLLHAGDLDLQFSGEYVLASGLTDFPLLQEIADMLPADPNERSSVLHNKAVVPYIVLITDARIEKALKEKHPLQADLKRNRSVLVGGNMTCLLTMRRSQLHKWLMSRAVVVPGTRKGADMERDALTYLIKCKKDLPANIKQLQALLDRL